MLESLSCIFCVKSVAPLSIAPILGELPEELSSVDIPALETGGSALRRMGGKLVILAPDRDNTVIGFVLDDVPPATQLQKIARQLASLAASGAVAHTSEPHRGGPNAARLLAGYLGKASGRLPRGQLLSLCCDALTTAGVADKAAIIICRPEQQTDLTLSSLALEPVRDAVADIFQRWRTDHPVARRITAQDIDGEDLLQEDAILLLDKVNSVECFLSLPARGEAGFGFLLFEPAVADPETQCEDARGVLELRFKTRRDWSRRRVYIQRGWMAAAAAMLVFLLLPTDRFVTASGVTRPRDVQIVSVHFPTYLDEMVVEIGQTLEPGDPIAMLVAPDQEDAQASALFQRSVEEAAANAALAAENYGAYVQAQSRVALQRTRLQQIEDRMGLLNPVVAEGGRVVAALSAGERGRFLPAGTEIARIQVGHRYSFELTLSPSDAAYVALGQTGELSLRGQLDRAYTIRMLTPPSPDARADQNGGPPVLVATALIVSNGEEDFVPGLSGFVQINTGRAVRLSVWSRHIVEFVRMKAWTILNWRI